MKNKFIFMIIFSILILLYGCLEQGKLKQCCDPTYAADPGECVFPDGTLPEETNSCDLDSHLCTVSFGKDINQNPIWEEIPICTQELPDDECTANECKVMICGQFEYKPSVFGGAGAGEIVNSDYTVNKEQIGDTSSKEEKNPGLFEGWCLFIPFNYQVSNVFEDSEGGIYINSFRFGVGNTFDQYEKYKLYFPITDKICSSDVSAGSGQPPADVDRYMNYLMPAKKTWDYISGGGDYFDPLVELTGDYCTQFGNFVDPLTTKVYGGDTNDYVYTEGNENELDYNGKWYKSFREALEADGETPIPPEEYYGPDKGFYRDALTYTYWSDIIDTDTARAPFECSTYSNDCLSGSCDTSVYSRTVCILEGSGGGAPCACTANKKKFYGDHLGSYIVCDAKTKGEMTIDTGSAGPENFNYNFFEDKITREQEDLRYDVVIYLKIDSWTPEGAGVRYTTADLDDITSDYYVNLFGLGNKKEWVGLYLHKEIVFTGAPVDGSWMGMKDPNMGYSYMNAEDFERSALVESCSLVKCVLPEEEDNGNGGAVAGKSGNVKIGTTVGNKYVPFDDLDYILLDIEFNPEEGSDEEAAQAEDLIYQVLDLVEQAYMDGLDITEANGKLDEAVQAYEEGNYQSSIALAQESIDIIELLYEEFEEGITAEHAQEAIDRAKDGRESVVYPMEFMAYVDYLIEKAETAFDEGNYEYAKELADKAYEFLVTGEINEDYMELISEEEIIYEPLGINSEKGKLAEYALTHNCDYFVFDHDEVLEKIKKETGWFPGDSGHPDSKDIFGFYTHEETTWLTSHIYSIAYVAQNEIQIYSLGNCVDDPENPLDESLQPKVATFGWCEPCTYATFAYESNPATAFEGTTDFAKDLKESTEYYLGQDIIPIINLSYDNYWTNAYHMGVDDNYETLYEYIIADEPVAIPNTAATDFLEENSGPAIIIVANIDDDEKYEPFWLSQGKVRAAVAKELCPKCLIAVHISLTGGWNHGVPSGNERAEHSLYVLNKMIGFDEDERIRFDEIFGLSGDVGLDYVDVIAFDFYPDEYAKGNKDWCTGGDEQNAYIVAKLTNISNEILYRTGKPSIVLNFGIRNDDTCFTDEKNDIFFTYLFMMQKNLTKNAILGIVYSDIEAPYKAGEDSAPVVTNSPILMGNPIDNSFSSKYYSEKFCDLQTSAKKLISGIPQYIYHEIFLQEEVLCTKCNDMDISSGECNYPESHKCKIGDSAIGECTMPLEVPASEKYVYKCPTDTIQGTCDSCSAINTDFTCKISHANGQVTYQKFNPSQISDLSLYPEYVANLYDSNGDPVNCCVEKHDGSKSIFIEKGGTPTQQHPIVYSSTANPFEDCNFYQDATLLNSFCGVELSIPIFDYEVECTSESIGLVDISGGLVIIGG